MLAIGMWSVHHDWLYSRGLQLSFEVTALLGLFCSSLRSTWVIAHSASGIYGINVISLNSSSSVSAASRDTGLSRIDAVDVERSEEKRKPSEAVPHLFFE